MKTLNENLRARLAVYITIIVALVAGCIACVVVSAVGFSDYNIKMRPGYNCAFAQFVDYKQNALSNGYCMQYTYEDNEGNIKSGEWEKPVAKEEQAKALLGKEILVYYNPKTGVEVCDFDFSVLPYGIGIGIGTLMFLIAVFYTFRLIVMVKKLKRIKSDKITQSDNLEIAQESLQNQEIIYDITVDNEAEKESKQTTDFVQTNEQMPNNRWEKLANKKLNILVHIAGIVAFTICLIFMIGCSYISFVEYKDDMEADYQPKYATIVGYRKVKDTLKDSKNNIYDYEYYVMAYEFYFEAGRKYSGIKTHMRVESEDYAQSLIGKDMLIFVDENLQRITPNLHFTLNEFYFYLSIAVLSVVGLINSIFWTTAYICAIKKSRKTKQVEK